MLKAETGAQAQAQLSELLHAAGAANGIDIRGMEDWRVKPLGNDYGEVSVTVRFTCKIEQLVNFLAALANVPQLLSTNQIAINGTTDPKNKSIQVRLSLSGVVSKKLVPEERGAHYESQTDPAERGAGGRDCVRRREVARTGIGRRRRGKRRCAMPRSSRSPPPAFYPLPNDPPVMPVGYKDVAMKTLFHPSRDPNEPVELPPPPPPPPPMPALPRYHGQMNLGDGPVALLVERPGMAEKSLKIGETIGQFKLVDVNTSEITFQWTFNGEMVRRTLGQLIDHTAAARRRRQPRMCAPRTRRLRRRRW